MNAQSKNLTRIAAALVLAMACGNTWAEDPLATNSITFEGATRGTGNGKNNAANINGSGGAGIDVKIKQINAPDATYTNSVAAQMNQVGDYVNNSALSIGGNAKVRIGQGAAVDDDGGFVGENDSKNNLVKGSITGTGTVAYIGQTGAGSSGKRLAEVTMTGGTLKANQAADDQELLVSGMASGTVKINQKATATGGRVTVGKTADHLTEGSMATGSVDIEQNAANQTATVTTMSGGTLKVKQEASGQTATIASMSGGTLNVYQKSTATDSTVNVTRFTGGSTTINQGDGTTAGSGAHSTLELDSGATTGPANGSANYTGVNINQYGSYQDAKVTYVNGGYTGDLNLNANGAAAAGEGQGATPEYRATVDVKM